MLSNLHHGHTIMVSLNIQTQISDNLIIKMTKNKLPNTTTGESNFHMFGRFKSCIGLPELLCLHNVSTVWPVNRLDKPDNR